MASLTSGLSTGVRRGNLSVPNYIASPYNVDADHIVSLVTRGHFCPWFS